MLALEQWAESDLLAPGEDVVRRLRAPPPSRLRACHNYYYTVDAKKVVDFVLVETLQYLMAQ